MSPWLKLALEIGPLAVFFITFNQLKQDPNDLDALLWATGAFMIALPICMGVTYALSREISKLAAITGVVVLVMGALTLTLQDETFIKMRPTLVNGALGAILIYGLFRGRSYLKLVIGELLPMRDEGWMKLTRNWAIFFCCMATLNEIIWRTQTTETWVDAKTFVYLPLTLIFTLSQTPLMSKHVIEEPGETT